jgi:hypothetical protein
VTAGPEEILSRGRGGRIQIQTPDAAPEVFRWLCRMPGARPCDDSRCNNRNRITILCLQFRVATNYLTGKFLVAHDALHIGSNELYAGIFVQMLALRKTVLTQSGATG